VAANNVELFVCFINKYFVILLWDIVSVSRLVTVEQ